MEYLKVHQELHLFLEYTPYSSFVYSFTATSPPIISPDWRNPAL